MPSATYLPRESMISKRLTDGSPWITMRSVVLRFNSQVVGQPVSTEKRASSDRSIAGEKPTDRELTGYAHRTLEFENRSLDNYGPDRDDLFIASNAASARSGRARTTKSSVRFTQRTFPDGSIRNSAGREMSAPSRRP